MSSPSTASPGLSLHGIRIVAFESRRAAELAQLLARHGAEVIGAPALREVPIEENAAAVELVTLPTPRQRVPARLAKALRCSLPGEADTDLCTLVKASTQRMSYFPVARRSFPSR